MVPVLLGHQTATDLSLGGLYDPAVEAIGERPTRADLQRRRFAFVWRFDARATETTRLKPPSQVSNRPYRVSGEYGKARKKFFWSVSVEKGEVSRLDRLTCILILLTRSIFSTFVLTMDMSFGKAKSGKVCKFLFVTAQEPRL